MARVVKRLRDGLIHKFIFGLDRTIPYVMTFDDDGIDSHEDLRPVHITWHNLDSSAVSWSVDHGAVGSGCLIRQREADPVNLVDAAMLQVGGVIVPKKDYASVSKKHATVKSHWGVLVYLETRYFLTATVLKQFAKGTAAEAILNPSTYIKDTRAPWHAVPEWVWKLVVSRMVQFHSPSADQLKRIRAKELKKLEEGMDPYRSTSSNSEGS